MPLTKIYDIRTVLPPVKKATFKGFGEKEDKDASFWGWCELYRDVCPIIRVYFAHHGAPGFHDFGLGEEMKDDIFGRYGLLNDSRDGKPLFTWSIPSTINPILVTKGDRPVHPPIDPHFIHIPAGWVKKVIAAAEQGIVRVTSLPYETNMFVGDKPFLGHHLIGQTADGTKLEAISDGGSPAGYRYVPPSPEVAKLLT